MRIKEVEEGGDGSDGFFISLVCPFALALKAQRIMAAIPPRPITNHLTGILGKQ